jgi:hypothetical protein
MKLLERLRYYDTLEPSQKFARLCSELETINSKLQVEPLNFEYYLDRAAAHRKLGYSDLVAGDAYRALTLLETYFDPEFSHFRPEALNWNGDVIPWLDDDSVAMDARRDMIRCLSFLVQALTDLGCLQDARIYLKQLDEHDKERYFLPVEEHQRLQDTVSQADNLDDGNAQSNGSTSDRKTDTARVRNFGFARREVYRWNDHEPDRSSSQTLEALNSLLEPVAPNLEVRLVELPVLETSDKIDPSSSKTEAQSSDVALLQSDGTVMCLQLGLFAKADLPPQIPILQEPSALAAVRPLDASLCHNCGAGIPEQSSSSPNDSDGPSCCPSCGDAAVFCCRPCLEIARTKYHSTTCGNEDIDPLGRDENSLQPSEDLYFLLLARAFAMSHAQNIHPLELPETKYLCGEFSPKEQPEGNPSRTLPFTFQHNIVLPFRLLSLLAETHPEMSPFSARGLDWYDTWVVQTLYAKFRGVASARQSTWDGKPEVAAVNPLWSLANHSCTPNVEWGWGRERVFKVREKPVQWGDENGGKEKVWEGIKAGEEILSHYCDVNLPVRDRREYMLGSLGGECKCERCLWESEWVVI